jgi:hypothetical protein
VANFKNFAYGLVATAPSPSPSGTQLVLGMGQGLRFPVAPFPIAIWPQIGMPDPTNAEIATCTAVVNDTLTIVRAQEDTSPRAIVAGDQVAAPVTKAFLDQVPLKTDPSVTWSGDQTINGTLTTSALTVTGTTTTADVQVSGTATLSTASITTLNVSGASALAGNLTVQDIYPRSLYAASLIGYDEPWQQGTITSGQLTIDYSAGNHVIVNLTADITDITISNVPAYGKVASVLVFYVGDGTQRTVTHRINGQGVRFPNAETFAMSPGSSKEDRILYTTWSGGTIWLGDIVGLNY